MAITKFFYVNSSFEPKDDVPFLNVHVIGDYGRTIPDYQKLVDEIMSTFPQAKLEDINLGVITKSSTYNGFAIATWSGYAEILSNSDWIQRAYYDYFLY